MSENETRIFNVLLAHKSRVETALEKLAKRAVKKGLPVLAWDWGKPYIEAIEKFIENGQEIPVDARVLDTNQFGVRVSVDIRRVPLTLPSEAPKYAGWKFVATLQHLDNENIVRSIPGETMPEVYRSRGPMCDHCRSLRRRNDTFVLRHDDNRTVQVGSTCIRDFLGSDEAGKIAALACLLSEARSVAEGGCEEGMGGGGSGEWLLSDLLPYVAWEIRTYGWVSRTQAREKGEETSATANRGWGYLTSLEARKKAGAKPTEEDLTMALASEAWCESLSDDAVNGEKGDYLHNIRAVSRQGLVSYRTAGLAASIVVAYQRHLGRERQKAERAARPVHDAFLGAVGDKVTFGLPAKVGKRGQTLKGAPIVLSSEPLTLDFVTGYSTEFGYTTVLKFRATNGAIIVWKASNTEIERADVGKRYTLAGSIKAHVEYKGEKQTVMSRCDVQEVSAVETAETDAA